MIISIIDYQKYTPQYTEYLAEYNETIFRPMLEEYLGDYSKGINVSVAYQPEIGSESVIPIGREQPPMVDTETTLPQIAIAVTKDDDNLYCSLMFYFQQQSIFQVSNVFVDFDGIDDGITDIVNIALRRMSEEIKRDLENIDIGINANWIQMITDSGMMTYEAFLQSNDVIDYSKDNASGLIIKPRADIQSIVGRLMDINDNLDDTQEFVEEETKRRWASSYQSISDSPDDNDIPVGDIVINSDDERLDLFNQFVDKIDWSGEDGQE